MRENPNPEPLHTFIPENIPFFFGIAVFTFEGNGIVLSLHSSMREPHKYNNILILVTTIYVLMIIIIGTISYAVSVDAVLISVFRDTERI
jgi:proton-coupled amino acid transporter